MTEHVVALDLDVTWDPNAPSAILLADDLGNTVLALRPHPEDADTRSVVLSWSGTRSACMADPNDEAISGHRLYRSGLRDVLWVGVVRDSDAIRALELQNSVHPFHDATRFDGLAHHIVRLKECVAEVVAETVSVRRIQGTTLSAAAAEMRE